MLGLALGLGALVRLYRLGALSFDCDELFAALPQGWSARSVLGVVLGTGFDDQHPPLYYLAALGWDALAGTSETAVRLPSALCGLATLPVVYVLGADLRSRRVGAWGALVLAVMPFHVYYSREARMYALLALLAAVSTWLLVRLGRSEGRAGARRGRWLAGYLAAAGAMSLTHYFGVVVVMAHALAVALRGRRGAPVAGAWLAVFGAVAGVFAPFAVFAAWQARHRDHSYFHFDLPVYRGLLCWLGASHPHLPLACALPVVLLALAGSLDGREDGGRDAVLPGPPPASRRERGVLLAVAAAGGVVAVAASARAGAVGAGVTAFRSGAGEGAALALAQGHAAAAALVVGAVGLAAAAALLAWRDPMSARLGSALERVRWPGPPAADPLASLPRLAALMVGLPLAITLVAGTLGMPLVLARNFLPSAPFVALMVACGLDSLPGRLRASAGALLVLGGLAVAGRFGAAPVLEAPRVRVRDWLEDVYGDWRRLRAIIPADGLPVVTVQSFATDGVMYYEADHDVVRLVPGEGATLVVGQLQRAAASHARAPQVGDTFPPPAGGPFWWVDPRTASARLAAARAPVAARIEAGCDCRQVGVVPEDAVVYRCAGR